jgi:hypothetical protein
VCPSSVSHSLIPVILGVPLNDISSLPLGILFMPGTPVAAWIVDLGGRRLLSNTSNALCKISDAADRVTI